MFRGNGGDYSSIRTIEIVSGSVYTNALSFVTASSSMWWRLLFTRHRSRPLAKTGSNWKRWKNGASSKRYGFISRVNRETVSNWIRLLFCPEIWIVQVKMVNLAGVVQRLLVPSLKVCLGLCTVAITWQVPSTSEVALFFHALKIADFHNLS